MMRKKYYKKWRKISLCSVPKICGKIGRKENKKEKWKKERGEKK